MESNQVETVKAILENCATTLFCRNDRYYPDKNFGSKIRQEDSLTEDLLLAYARQALSGLDGVFVKSASFLQDNAVFEILINNEREQVSISL